MSELRERIALLIESAERHGWHTIVVPIEMLRPAFMGTPAGMEAKLRKRVLRAESPSTDAPLQPSDTRLLNDAADMIALLAAEYTPYGAEGPHPVRLLHLIDYCMLYLPPGELYEGAERIREELREAIAPTGERTPQLTPVHAENVPEQEAWAQPIDPKIESRVTDSLMATIRSLGLTGQEGDVRGALSAVAERIHEFYISEVAHLAVERDRSQQFENRTISDWMTAHEKAIAAEKRARKAEQRARETVERCARIVEMPIPVPQGEPRTIRLVIEAVQRHLASAIRREGGPG